MGGGLSEGRHLQGDRRGEDLGDDPGPGEERTSREVGNVRVFPATPPGSLFIGSWLGTWLPGTGHRAATRTGVFRHPLSGRGVPFSVVCAAPQWALPAPPPASLPQPTKVVRPQPPFSSPAGRPWPWWPVSLQNSVLALLPPAPRRPPKPSSTTTGRGGGGGGPSPVTIFHIRPSFAKRLPVGGSMALPVSQGQR